MAEIKYTQAQIDALCADDASLGRASIDKYADYKSKDPFPKVGEALLNSADLLMYILTVGIVEPFCVDNLKGVTYACSFSGEAHFYDTTKNKMVEKKLNDNEALELEQNSITYLKIEEKFHVPDYMALRFNLSVSNAYKGVLLGTGPIVDPGFEGSLFIPLHNLTGNKYTIKKGASLIRVEFTKLSRHKSWNNKNIDLFPTLKPITKNTPRNAGFYKFFEEALLDSDKKMFHTKEDVVSVRSSIPDAIATAASKADEAQINADKSASAAEALSKKARNWSIIGGIGAVLTIITLMISVYALILDTTSRYDNIVQDIEYYRQQIQFLDKKIETQQEMLEQYEIILNQALEQESKSKASDETADYTTSSSDSIDLIEEKP